MAVFRRAGGLVGALLLLAVPAAAQSLPQETVSLAGGRLTVGGEATATVVPDDDGQSDQSGRPGRAARAALRRVAWSTRGARTPDERG